MGLHKWGCEWRQEREEWKVQEQALMIVLMRACFVELGGLGGMVRHAMLVAFLIVVTKYPSRIK